MWELDHPAARSLVDIEVVLKSRILIMCLEESNQTKHYTKPNKKIQTNRGNNNQSINTHRRTAIKWASTKEKTIKEREKK